MNILIACERSGVIRDAFRALGYNAISCDLVPSERPGPHIQADVRTILNEGWDLMIAHPECKVLSYAGNAHWNKPGRAELRTAAMAFFMEMINAPIPRICVENPTGLPCREYRKPDQIVNPFQFGDPHRKRTCLWLKHLPKLMYWETDNLFGGATVVIPQAIYTTERATGIKYRYWAEALHGQDRSRSFPGIASAMANQWGGLENVRST